MRRLMYAGAIALLAIVFTVPSDFASMEGFTLDARGQILVSGDTSSNKEMLTAIGVLQLVLHHQLIEPRLRLG